MNVTIAGVRATGCDIRVPSIGAWVADVELDTADALPSGKIALVVGGKTFTGTIDPRFSGTFGGRRRVRVVAGANGWSSTVVAKHFHNDALVTDRTVLQATASECGETIVFDAPAVRLGADYVRRRERGGAVVQRLATGGWFVAYDGVTHAGPRTPAALGKFSILDFDSRENLVTIATEDAQAIGIGATLTDRLDAPLVVRQIVIKVDVDGARLRVWGTS